MEELYTKLKQEISQLAASPNFANHQWFVQYHLEIVEKIALELCELYPQADQSFIRLLVWFHDYGKLVDYANQYKNTQSFGHEFLTKLGFPPDLSEKLLHYVNLIDNISTVDGVDKLPIEVKILVSSDGASHFIGPFHATWLYEHPQQPLVDLLQSNLNKAHKDYDKKIVLPEVKEFIKSRFEFVLEQNGQLPDRFLPAQVLK
jgi:hypothetical protein